MYLSANRAKISIRGYIDNYSDRYQASIQKMSSGSKYVSNSENPVEYFSGEKVSAQIRHNKSLVNSISTGNDMMVIAETAEGTVSDNILAIKDLCLQAANGTYSADDKDKIIAEIRGRLEYIDSAANTTTYAGRKLLDGSCTSFPIQISTAANDSINIAESLLDVRTTSLGIDLDPTVTGATWTNTDINTYMDALNLATDNITISLTNIGNYSNRLDIASDRLITMNENLTELNSFYSDDDIAKTSAEVVQNQILEQTAVTLLAQANSMTGKVYSLLGN